MKRGEFKLKERDLIGAEFGQLTVIKEAKIRLIGKREVRKRYFLCKCECGTVKEVSLDHLRGGKIKSCGCALTCDHFKTHGLTDHPLYGVWSTMKQRCYDKGRERYSDWGGRGIKVCKEWKNDFEAFYNWSMANGYRRGLQIDRINNDGNYSPLNCRYVTAKVNSNNRRKRSPNVISHQKQA